jgi:hypothetical protein
VVIGLGKYHELEDELVKFDINGAQLFRGHISYTAAILSYTAAILAIPRPPFLMRHSTFLRAIARTFSADAYSSIL